MLLSPENLFSQPQTQEQYPMWIAVITGKMGKAIDNGFELDQPAIQAFEIEPKNPSA